MNTNIYLPVQFDMHEDIWRVEPSRRELEWGDNSSFSLDYYIWGTYFVSFIFFLLKSIFRVCLCAGTLGCVEGRGWHEMSASITVHLSLFLSQGLPFSYTSRTVCPQPLECWSCRCMAHTQFPGLGDPHSGLHACTASTLFSESSSQPHYNQNTNKLELERRLGI